MLKPCNCQGFNFLCSTIRHSLELLQSVSQFVSKRHFVNWLIYSSVEFSSLLCKFSYHLPTLLCETKGKRQKLEISSNREVRFTKLVTWSSFFDDVKRCLWAWQPVEAPSDEKTANGMWKETSDKTGVISSKHLPRYQRIFSFILWNTIVKNVCDPCQLTLLHRRNGKSKRITTGMRTREERRHTIEK